MKPVLFHHVYCPAPGPIGGVWRPILHDQLAKYRDSGLAEAGATMTLGVIGTEGDREELKARLWQYPFIEKVIERDISENDDNLYEGATLQPLWEWCVAHHGAGGERVAVCYTHSKGTVTYNACVHDWKEMMEYFIIECWRSAVQAIEEGAEIVGCDWKHAGDWHFSGNFWWAASDYIATLPDPRTDCAGPGKGYYDAGPNVGDNTRAKYEMWLASPVKTGRYVKVHELHNSGVDNHYLQPYPRKRYAPTRFQLTPDEEAWLRERYTRKAG